MCLLYLRCIPVRLAYRRDPSALVRYIDPADVFHLLNLSCSRSLHRILALAMQIRIQVAQLRCPVL